MKRIFFQFPALLFAVALGLGAGQRLDAQTPSGIVLSTLPLYQQTSASAESLSQVAVVYDVIFPPGAAAGATVQVQGPAGSVSLAAQPDGSYLSQQLFPSLAAASTAFPNGAYTVVVGGSSPTSTPVTVSNGASVSPVLITNYNSLQAASAQPVTPTWAGITGAQATDFIDVEVDDSSGDELFGAESGDLGLTPTSTSLAIPVLPTMGALAGNLTYGSATVSAANNGRTMIEVLNGFVVQFGLQVAVPSSQSQNVATGSTVVFNSGVSGVTATYQWNFNGSAIAGATGSTYVLSNAQAANAGSYTVTVTDASGVTTSAASVLTVTTTGNPGRLLNISVRADVGVGNSVLIAGFAIGGAGTNGSEPILIRAVGPTLTTMGVTAPLPDPLLQIWTAGTTTALSSNQGWAGNAQIASIDTQVGAFPLTSGSADAAIYNSGMASGDYTAIVSGASGDSGIALAEVYDATLNYAASSPRLINISGRAQVGTGNNVLIAGFVIGGTTNKTVLIRAGGPALDQDGLAGLAAPQLQVFAGGYANPQWSDIGWNNDPAIASVAARVGAVSWAAGSADSAVLVTLPPGSYTAVVSGVNGGTGIALVEVYDVP